MHINILLVLAGVIGGAINSVAGGGGIIVYPALLVFGLSPVIANATSSLVVWPGSLASAYGYRQELRKVPRSYAWLALPCLAGAIIGATVLVHTRPATFEQLAPWLVFSAVLLLALQSQIHRWVSLQTKKRKLHWHTIPMLCIAAFPIAVYGGFFGIGFGLMMLAVLGFSSLKNVYQMNGVKNLMATVMAVTANIFFAQNGLIDWRAGLLVASGMVFGGYVGSRAAQKVSAHLVHDLTVVIGLIISIVLLLK